MGSIEETAGCKMGTRHKTEGNGSALHGEETEGQKMGTVHKTEGNGSALNGNYRRNKRV